MLPPHLPCAPSQWLSTRVQRKCLNPNKLSSLSRFTAPSVKNNMMLQAGAIMSSMISQFTPDLNARSVIKPIKGMVTLTLLIVAQGRPSPTEWWQTSCVRHRVESNSPLCRNRYRILEQQSFHHPSALRPVFANSPINRYGNLIFILRSSRCASMNLCTSTSYFDLGSL